MIDFHTHILPGIDDGSKDIQESMAMLRELYRQGADTVIATPHFYADRISPELFLQRRDAAWNALKPFVDDDMPKVIKGAEVLYYEGMYRTAGLRGLCIENTDILLLEMPTTVWTDRIIDTVLELNARPDISVMLAHIERYYPYNKKAAVFFAREGIPIQISTSCFVDKKTRRTSLYMLKKGTALVIGTDCHNMSDRRPDLDAALEVIKGSLGKGMISRIELSEEMLLNG